MNLAIMLFSFIMSTIISIFLYKKSNNKILSMSSALVLNTIFLAGATWIMYLLNEEAKAFGLGHSGLYVLLFAIPVITWMNFIILPFIKKSNRVH